MGQSPFGSICAGVPEPTSSACPADINGDCAVNLIDLLTLLGDLGAGAVLVDAHHDHLADPKSFDTLRKSWFTSHSRSNIRRGSPAESVRRTIGLPTAARVPAMSTAIGAVDLADLLAMLAAWGLCPAPCAADLDGDGIVNLSDLLILLAGWS